VAPNLTLTRALAAALTTAALAAPASQAQPADAHLDAKVAAAPLSGPPLWPAHPRPINDAAQVTDAPADFASVARAQERYYSSFGARIGDANATIGDTKADAPGASGTPDYAAPRTIEIVRPERTVLRHDNQALPLALAGLALALALGGLGVALAAAGRTPRRLLGRSH